MVMCKVWRGYGCSPPVEGPSTQAATAPLRRRRRTAAAAPRKKYMLKFRITSQISVCGKIGRRKAPSNYHARTNANHHQHTQRYSDDAQHRHKNDHHFYRHNIITAIDVGRDIEVLSRSLLHSSFARPLHHRSTFVSSTEQSSWCLMPLPGPRGSGDVFPTATNSANFRLTVCLIRDSIRARLMQAGLHCTIISDTILVVSMHFSSLLTGGAGVPFPSL